MLRIANLCKTYKITNSKKQDVLKGINLELKSKEMVALLGESGSGKSTLLNILGGLDTDYTGSVVIKGKYIRDFSDKEMDDYRKNTIGFVFQNYNLISHMTIFENVEIALQMSDIDKNVRKKRVKELLKMVGLESHMDKLPSQLSGGQKQRVSIARSLANNPSIILADEPTGALDKESAAQVLKILKKISEMGKLVIVVTHSAKVAKECSRVIKLDDGIIISDEQTGPKPVQKYEKYIKVPLKNIRTIEIIKISFRNVKEKLSRSLLVSFAISIGIAALIIILALSQGLTDYVTDYYNQNELSTIISVTKNEETLSTNDIESIKTIDGVINTSQSHFEKEIEFSYETTSRTLDTVQVYLAYNKPEVIYGEQLPDDNEILIDLDLAIELAPNGAVEVLGKTLSFTSQEEVIELKVVGIYDDDLKSEAYVTAVTMEQIQTVDTINVLFIKVKNITYVEAVTEEIKMLGLQAETKDDSSQLVLEYIDLGTKVLTVVAAISTIVSAIMIIIVLYISVVERTQEIGILRSIGGRKKDIYKIFMFESSILGTAGGLFGIVISLIVSLITNSFSSIMIDIQFISYSPVFYIIGFVISILVSIIAGIAPSSKAAKLDPIEALRFE